MNIVFGTGLWSTKTNIRTEIKDAILSKMKWSDWVDKRFEILEVFNYKPLPEQWR